MTLLCPRPKDSINDNELKANTFETETFRIWERGELEKLFETQIKRLEDRGCPGEILCILESRKNAAIQKASGIFFGEKILPFLLVVSRQYVESRMQALMIRCEEDAVHYCLKPEDVVDVLKTPETPYIIFGVENGGSLRGKTAEAAQKIIAEQSRRPLTEIEVINLCIHQTDVLEKHGIDALGSRFKGGVPSIYSDEDDSGKVKVSWVFPESASFAFGAASCAA